MKTGLRDLGVWITGALGGIGQAIARGFAEEECRLALHANGNLDALERFVASGATAAAVWCGAADVRDEAALDAHVGAAVAGSVAGIRTLGFRLRDLLRGLLRSSRNAGAWRPMYSNA